VLQAQCSVWPCPGMCGCMSLPCTDWGGGYHLRVEGRQNGSLRWFIDTFICWSVCVCWMIISFRFGGRVLFFVFLLTLKPLTIIFPAFWSVWSANTAAARRACLTHCVHASLSDRARRHHPIHVCDGQWSEIETIRLQPYTRRIRRLSFRQRDRLISRQERQNDSRTDRNTRGQINLHMHTRQTHRHKDNYTHQMHMNTEIAGALTQNTNLARDTICFWPTIIWPCAALPSTPALLSPHMVWCRRFDGLDLSLQSSIV
jgi:hypothetical protein